MHNHDTSDDGRIRSPCQASLFLMMPEHTHINRSRNANTFASAVGTTSGNRASPNCACMRARNAKTPLSGHDFIMFIIDYLSLLLLLVFVTTAVCSTMHPISLS